MERGESAADNESSKPPPDGSPPAGTVSGRIRVNGGESGNGNIRIFLEKTDFTAVSDEAGYFLFSGVPPERIYPVLVSFAGHTIFWKNAEISAGKTCDLGTKILARGYLYPGPEEKAVLHTNMQRRKKLCAAGTSGKDDNRRVKKIKPTDIFAGWNTAEDGLGRAYFPGDEIVCEQDVPDLHIIRTGFQYETDEERTAAVITCYESVIDWRCVIPDTINTIPVTAIAEKAFISCVFWEMVIPESVTSIGAEAFDSTGIRIVSIPGGVSRIRAGTFRGCPLDTIKIGAGVEIEYASPSQATLGPKTEQFINEYEKNRKKGGLYKWDWSDRWRFEGWQGTGQRHYG
ncbi:MAG: leucine-rich repeat protein [Spirochaetaceae bacterium]|jgi:hypothetical protein|nr:leucine-rich repeat protein [Spirochaetaceae bacterium]